MNEWEADQAAALMADATRMMAEAVTAVSRIWPVIPLMDEAGRILGEQFPDLAPAMEYLRSASRVLAVAGARLAELEKLRQQFQPEIEAGLRSVLGGDL